MALYDSRVSEQKPEDTFDNSGVFLPGVPVDISKIVHQSHENNNYKLHESESKSL